MDGYRPANPRVGCIIVLAFVLLMWTTVDRAVRLRETANAAPPDEITACRPDSRRDCQTGYVGECADGWQYCRPNLTGWISWCQPLIDIDEDVEHCDNGLDDDCDGQVDELDCGEIELLCPYGGAMCKASS